MCQKPIENRLVGDRLLKLFSLFGNLSMLRIIGYFMVGKQNNWERKWVLREIQK